jgi:hypothetical protein
VLIEATSVVVRLSAIEASYPGGWKAFVADAPNATLCGDGHLARVGFMDPSDVEGFVRRLERRGLRYLVDGSARDFLVVDQQLGPTAPCDWIGFGRADLPPGSGHEVSGCWLLGESRDCLVTPDGWKYEGSLSQTFIFVPDGELEKSLHFLRHEDGCDVFLNVLTGREVYLARTGEG